jgi:hypothetical protein
MESLGEGAKVPVLVKVTEAGPAKKPAGRPTRAGAVERDAERLKAIGRLAPGGWFRTTLVSYRSGAPRLYLDTWMREAAGVGVGDSVRVTLKLDNAPRTLEMPQALREALEGNPAARTAWDALAPSRRREILSYLNFLKTPAALERNVQKTIAEVLGARGTIN